MLPFVVFFQPIVLGWFPSNAFPKWRKPYQCLALAGAVILAFMFGCTTLFHQPANDHDKLPTMLWGGREPSLWIILAGIGFWSVGAVAFSRPVKYGTRILAVGGCVLALLWIFDGTIRLLSKMCTYCLLLSIIWVLEPYEKQTSADDEDDTAGEVALGRLLLGEETGAPVVGAVVTMI